MGSNKRYLESLYVRNSFYSMQLVQHLKGRPKKKAISIGSTVTSWVNILVAENKPSKKHWEPLFWEE